MRALRIGEVAKQSDVGIETIRYYERQGLLAEPDRRPSGYRQYDGAVVARLQFIRRAKELGFTLAEIKELLGLWFDVRYKVRPCAAAGRTKDRQHRRQDSVAPKNETVAEEDH